MSYGIKKEVNLNFEETVIKVKEELKKEGFGVLTEINVKNTLNEKLGINYDDYIILGACNPSFAYKALQSEKEIGLLLPCNIIVYSQNDKTIISAINPAIAMSIVENESLKEIASEVGEKLKKVIYSLGDVKGDNKNENRN